MFAPQLTENMAAANKTSSSTNFARRLLPIATIPNMLNGRIAAKTGRGPCLSSPVEGLAVPEPATMLTVIVADGVDVPSIANEVGDAEQVAPEGALHVRLTG